MLTLPPSVRIYVAIAPCDMRKSFRGLTGLVRQRLCMKVQIDAGTLGLILEGIDLKSVKRRVRHHRPKPPPAKN